jgi:hypothetical protein
MRKMQECWNTNLRAPRREYQLLINIHFGTK